MRSSAFLVLSFIASAWAYSVTFPTQTQGWTNSGAQTLSWTRVDTDPLNFTALLTNQDTSILATSEILAALVNGTSGTTLLNAPSAGWPVGSGFQVNLVKDTNNFNTIYAQSNQFNITAVPGSSSTSTGVTTQGGNTITVTPAAAATVSATTTGSTTALNPTSSKSAALTIVGTNPVLAGVIALLGVLFA